jgi:hypothetical protein
MKISLVAARHAVPRATAGRPYKFYFRKNLVIVVDDVSLANVGDCRARFLPIKSGFIDARNDRKEVGDRRSPLQNFDNFHSREACPVHDTGAGIQNP